MVKYLLILLVLINIGLVSAVTCSPAQLITSYNQSETKQVSVSCNNLLNRTINLVKTGDYISISDTSIDPLSDKTITITFSSTAPIGFNSGTINFDDSTYLPIFFNVISKEEEPSQGIIVFPTAKVINVQTGQSKTQNIQVIVPASYKKSITLQSVNFNPDIDLVKFGDLDLGTISPGQTVNIPIKIDASNNVQIGSYSTQINILATDSDGQVKLSPSNLQIVVSIGVNAITNSTFNIKPSCSLSSVTMNMNESYTFTCSNAVENIEISPQYSEFFEGTKADYSSGMYTYTFRPIKMGNTKFIATFNYKNSPIYSPYSQDVRISSAGMIVPGTNLRISYYPYLNKINVGEQLIMQLVDNLSNTLVSSPQVFVNSVPISTINNSDKSFGLFMELNKNYEIRGSAPGYSDIVEIINISTLPIDYILIPDKAIYEVGDSLTVFSNLTNLTILYNNSTVSSYFTLSTPGTSNIRITKPGYIDAERNIQIVSVPTIVSCNIEYKDWSKGKDITCDLDKETNWSVYKDGVQQSSGQGKRITFKIDDYGNYEINSNDKIIYSYNLSNKGWFGFLTWDWIKSNWLISTGVILFVGFVFVIYVRKRNNINSITPLS